MNKANNTAHINAYVLPDRILLMVMNTEKAAQQVDFNINLEPWLKSKSGGYEVRSYDENGKSVNTQNLKDSQWTGKTEKLDHMGISIYEFITL